MITVKKVLDTIQKYRMILPGEKIILGVSGGPDSTALLYLLYDLCEVLKCNLHLAHLDHKLRGEESKADAEYVEEQARKLNLPVTIEAIDVHKMLKPKESVESGARRVRYDFYERVMANSKADKVAQGHTADDQAETVLMHLLRGSGPQGLGGIPPVRDGKFIRPLIEISRSEINEYLQELKITPRQDSSNLSTEYERNKIRIELIPLLERKYNPNIKRILQQTGEIMRVEDELLTNLAQNAAESCVERLDSWSAAIIISKFKEYNMALQRRILRLVIGELARGLEGFDYDHIRDLTNIAIYGATGSSASLPREISVEKAYDRLIIRHGYQPEKPASPFDYKVKFPGETLIPKLSLIIKTTAPERICGKYKNYQADEDRFHAAFDYDKIRGDLRLRNRRPGDRFRPLGMSGTKKLQDFFTDEKVPKLLRDSIPILTDEDDILWVVGYRMDDRFKITSTTKNRITVTAINC